MRPNWDWLTKHVYRLDSISELSPGLSLLQFLPLALMDCYSHGRGFSSCQSHSFFFLKKTPQENRATHTLRPSLGIQRLKDTRFLSKHDMKQGFWSNVIIAFQRLPNHSRWCVIHGGQWKFNLTCISFRYNSNRIFL